MKNATRIQLVIGAVCMMVLSGPGMQPQRGHAEDDPLGECKHASSSELDEIRGGYVADNGVEFALGIAKSIMVNGIPVVLNTLNLGSSDLAAATGSSRNVNLIQNGAGNSVDPNILASQAAGNFTFIQNSLDRAVIQNLTKIDATVTVRGLYRDMNLSSVLNQQLINSRH
ncbi:hypothetical protein [Geomesophilobacter sediminis]|uniref:Uncharacterized protein n=1 Tax=Geomesophilobacter sediminis TaxID=2798584 RepID=A0A8J7SBU4_9BACT|nr:hypothetical protein [Geomesophilobacter sediminis]MBJ6727971.1 hypothetical protein [Geomesophilobacter sediminis]